MILDTQSKFHASKEAVARHPVPNVMPEEGTTTLMVRNLPRNYTANAIKREIDAFSPTSKYDLVYVPWDARRGSNISYAFVNFLDHGSALRAFFALSGRVWSFINTSKSCKFATAHIQGVPENLATYVANFGMTSDCPHAPTVFHNGKHIPWRRAVKLLCTDEMLARAAAVVQSKKLACEAEAEAEDEPEAEVEAEAEDEATNPQPKTCTQLATEFREKFLRFGETIAQSRDKFAGMDDTSQCDDEKALSHSEIEFWLRLHDLCHQVSMKPSIMPELDGIAMVTSAEETAESGSCRFQNTLAVAHAPGLIQTKGQVNNFAVQGEMLVAPRSFQRDGIELRHNRRGIVSWHNEGTKGVVDHHVPDLSLFTRPDEGRIPVPNFLIEGLRGL